MKTPEQEHLLNDVLHEGSYPAFRSELRKTMLAEVRRQHRRRSTKQLLALAACLPFALALVWFVQHRNSTTSKMDQIATVRSVPLKPEQIVTTAGHIRSVAVIQSRNIELSSLQFEVVRTVAQFRGDSLTDEQLLDLFKDRPIALIDSGAGKRLLFLDEERETDSANP